jgi:hypothetical protein
MHALAPVDTEYESRHEESLAKIKQYTWGRFTWSMTTPNWLAADAHYLELNDADKHLALRIFLTSKVEHRNEVLPMLLSDDQSLHLLNAMFDSDDDTASFVLQAMHRKNIVKHTEDNEFITELFANFNSKPIFGRKTLAEFWREAAFDHYEIEIDYCVQDVVAEWKYDQI